jgi:hypothetical protein
MKKWKEEVEHNQLSHKTTMKEEKKINDAFRENIVIVV